MPTDSTPAESTATNSAARDHADAAESGAESDDGTADADRVAALERRVADLEAELEAVRGLLAGVEVVDESIDRRASTALAKAEALEERFAPDGTGLVRERLPDPSGGDRREDGAGERPPDPHDNPEDPPQRTGSPARRDSTGERDTVGYGHVTDFDTPECRNSSRRYTQQCENRGDSTGPRGGHDRGRARGTDGRESTGSAGRDRAHAGGGGTADGGATGPGAISSVGSGASTPKSDPTDTEDTDRSLAERLRDAFR
jgi:hypothetical protein